MKLRAKLKKMSRWKYSNIYKEKKIASYAKIHLFLDTQKMGVSSIHPQNYAFEINAFESIVACK